MDFALDMIIIGSVLFLLGSIVNLQNDIKRMDKKVDDIRSSLGIEDENIDQEALRDLIDNGKRIKAVKKLRMDTGMGLKEAKEYVDKIYYQK